MHTANKAASPVQCCDARWLSCVHGSRLLGSSTLKQNRLVQWIMVVEVVVLITEEDPIGKLRRSDWWARLTKRHK